MRHRGLRRSVDNVALSAAQATSTRALIPDTATLKAPLRGAKLPPRLWLAVLAVALIAALGALAGWRMGWFGGTPRPKALLRQQLEAPPAMPAGREPVAAQTISPLVPPGAPSPETPPSSGGPADAGTQVVVELPASVVTPAPAKPAPAAQAGASASGARFAIEFGPFMTAGEAERVERQLNESGYQTVRFRQQTGGALYAVLIEKISSMRDAQALVAGLREQGFGSAFVVGGREPLSVQVGLPLPLRGAVQMAERLRGGGHQVRLAVQPGEAVTFAIRHGNFATLQEAETKGQELLRLGLGNQVVRVK